MSIGHEIELARREIPRMAAVTAQLIVDNPGQVAIMAAGSIVLVRAALNIVKPRSMIEFLALCAVLEIGAPYLMRTAIERGWLKFRIRDEAGELVPFDPSAE